MSKWQSWLALALLVVGAGVVPANEPIVNGADCNTCQTGCATGCGASCWAKLKDFLTYRPLRSPCECKSLLWPSQTCTPSVYEFFRYRASSCGFNATYPAGCSSCGTAGCSKCKSGCADGTCGR